MPIFCLHLWRISQTCMFNQLTPESCINIPTFSINSIKVRVCVYMANLYGKGDGLQGKARRFDHSRESGVALPIEQNSMVWSTSPTIAQSWNKHGSDASLATRPWTVKELRCNVVCYKHLHTRNISCDVNMNKLAYEPTAIFFLCATARSSCITAPRHPARSFISGNVERKCIAIESIITNLTF